MPIDYLPMQLDAFSFFANEKPEIYLIRKTVPQGSPSRPANGTNEGNVHTITWPSIQELKSTLATQSMRFSKIEWHKSSVGIYNIKLTNKKE